MRSIRPRSDRVNEKRSMLSMMGKRETIDETSKYLDFVTCSQPEISFEGKP